MKRCPECRRDYYDDSLLYCLDDGTQLLDGPATDQTREEAATAILDSRADIHDPAGERKTQVFDKGGMISKEVKRHKLGFVLVSVIVLVILAGFGYGIYKLLDRGPAPQASRSAANPTTQRLSGDGRTREPVISPDGKVMVYAKLEGGKQSLWIKQIQTGSNVNVVKPGESDEFWGITFSPDGNFVYYNAGGRTSREAPTVFRVPSLGGAPTTFLSNATLVRFSPDGKRISFRRPDLAAVKESVFIANADGTGERELLSRTGSQFFASAADWSPDGKSLAVAVGDDAKAPNPIVSCILISVADGSTADVGSKTWEDITNVVWHPSGDSLFILGRDTVSTPGGQIWEMSYPQGEFRKLTNDVNGYGGLSITGDGKSIVTAELYARTSILVSPDLKPENAKQILPPTGDTWGIAWTPDGRIVYSSDQSGVPQIWIMDSDGGNSRALTSDNNPKFFPTVSSDGRYVIYTSRLNNGELVRIDIGGGNPLTLAQRPSADNADVSPDGKWVIYSAYVDGIPRVLRVPIGGGESQVLTPALWADEPHYSTDGTRFACFVLDQKSLTWKRIAIFPAEGGEPVRFLDVPGDTNHGRGPVWTPDDKNLVLVIAPGETQELFQLPVDGSPGKQITNVGVPGIARREYSPDGKRIAIVRAEGFGNAIMLTGFR